MSETIAPDIPAVADVAQRPSFIERKVAAIYAVAGGLIVGGLGGAIFNNYDDPASINYADGVSADASLTAFNKGVDANFLVTEIVDSSVPVDTPLPGVQGVHAKITDFRLNLSDKDAQAEYVGLFSNFKNSVAGPTADTIASHLAMGAGIGAATVAGASYLGVRYMRHVRSHKAETLDDIAGLREEGTPRTIASANRQERKLLRDSRIRKAGAVLAGLAILGGSANVINKAYDIETASSAPGVNILERLVDEEPSLKKDLKGIKIIGGGDQINAIIYGILDQKRDAEKPWKKAYQNLTPAWLKYAQTDGAEYLNDPDYLLLIHATDPHCNFANNQYFYSPALKLIAPDFMDLTGDLQTNSGTMFYEKDCIPSLVRASTEAGIANHKVVETIINGGNHDNTETLDSSSHVHNLDKDHVVKVGNLVFVGRKDPRSTVWNTQRPGEDQLLTAQGAEIAKDACAQDQVKNAVVVNSHDIRAGLPSTVLGCADLVLNGHTHNETPFKTSLGQNGNLVTQHTGGSESGAGSGFSLYDGLQKDAYMSGIFYSLSQNRFVHTFTIKVDKDNSSVAITSQDLPVPLEP